MFRIVYTALIAPYDQVGYTTQLASFNFLIASKIGAFPRRLEEVSRPQPVVLNPVILIDKVLPLLKCESQMS